MKNGILSQCIKNSSHFQKGGKTRVAISNIMKQFINKCGVLCWWVRIPTVAPTLAAKSVMFIGIDVYHSKMTFEADRNIYKQRRSLGAFVMINVDHQGRYRTFCSIQPKDARKEIICKNESDTESVESVGSGSEISMKTELKLEGPAITQDNVLKNFIVNGLEQQNQEGVAPPFLVVVFRDGGGGSQLAAAREHEVSQVKEALPNSEIIFAVIQKNISVRYFINSQEKNEWGNPPGGTVINTFQTTKYEEFYLIPTKSNLSTVKPVRYILLEYASNLPKDEFQALTYTMCHLYPNWTDSVKLPFPTQLAHKLAYLVGEIKTENPTISNIINTKYFYL